MIYWLLVELHVAVAGHMCVCVSNPPLEDLQTATGPSIAQTKFAEKVVTSIVHIQLAVTAVLVAVVT